MAPSKTPARSPSTIPVATFRAFAYVSPLPLPTTPFSPPNQHKRLTPRPSRHPGLTIAGALLLGTGLTFRHVAKGMRENDVRQKNSPDGYLYVTVDRSGGGF